MEERERERRIEREREEKDMGERKERSHHRSLYSCCSMIFFTLFFRTLRSLEDGVFPGSFFSSFFFQFFFFFLLFLSFFLPIHVS